MEVQQPPTKIPRLSEREKEHERLTKLLEERLMRHDENRKAVQDKLHEICEGLRTQVDELEDRINKELEDMFTSEDNRLQAALNELRGSSTASALQKVRAELLTFQSYEIFENKEDEELDLATLYGLKAEKWFVPEVMEVRKPTNVRVTGVDRGRVCVQFTYLNPDEERVLSDRSVVNPVKFKCLLFKKGNEQESKEYPLDKNEGNGSSFSLTFTPDILEAETTYGTKVKMVVGDRESEWSDEIAEFTPEFKERCVWKKCPDDVDDSKKYSVDEGNPRVATKINNNRYDCTIIGDAYIPLNTVTSWSIKVLKSEGNNGGNIYIGVAPFDINQNANRNYNECGWYFDCYDSTLRSGPPHSYRRKEYGPRKEREEYVRTGDNVGVVMDTAKGELSFALNGANLGVAYEGIPLDKPLVPCVLLYRKGDSVELDTSEVKEDVDSSIPVPSNIISKDTTWDSITLTWDKVPDASFYQIEVDEDKSWGAHTTSSFTKTGLLPESEHSFRVRTVRGSSVSEWSGVVKRRTLKAPEFTECVWKECLDDVDDINKYSVDERNPRVATKINGYGECTIIGNTCIPLNKVTSWHVKVHKSKDNDESGIYIGVAPFDIDQNVNYNYDKCGWYFYCYSSTLISGPPHNYNRNKYGPRKGSSGQYVHTGDSVGVVVDTTKGELSFVLNEVNRGVAYEGIPLDKPLVPCVILNCQGDSVELNTSEVKENVDSSVPIPSNIIAKSGYWDSITLTWDNIPGAPFYQIEVDGSKSWDISTTSSSTKRGLFPETGHNFRVRTVRGSSVSEWSGVVKGRTLKAPEFTECVWKKCPGYVNYNKKYSVDGRNPIIATKINYDNYCTVIGNTYIPLNTVTSWSIKILKSKKNDGDGIYIGIAQNDINQNEWRNYNECGWYFGCFYSELISGPPHNYDGEEYGPRKEKGEYIHTGDSVGVVVDTTRGDLSFALNGVNLGVAYEEIPLDKPLVPCVLLYLQGDSVELVI